jgi:hypothetical protein
MLEPFSIVSSVFGLTTGSISLLLATVEKFVSTSQKAAQCKHRLRQVELHVGHMNRKLIAWVRKWAPDGEAFPESTYVFIWGDDGWASLQARVDAICQEIQQLEKILLTGNVSNGEGDSGLLTSLDSDTWHIAVTRAKGDVTKLAEHEVTIGKRIAFAIWESNLLAEGLDRLKKLVDDIDADSRLLAADVVWKLGNNLPESYRTNMAQFYDTRTKPLWQELDECHKTLSSKLETCAILFRPPKSQDFWNIQNERSLAVEFVCTRGTSATQDEGHWISTDFDFHDRLRTCLAVQLQPIIEHLSKDSKNCENCDRAILEKTLKQTLTTLSSMHSRDHRAFCKERGLERLQTALAVATWAMYAWPTAWVKTICSCGIRNALLPGGQRFPVLEEVAHHEQGCLIEEICRPNASRYLLLGVLLAEIALARPIRVIEDNNDASELFFELHDPRVVNREPEQHLRRHELLHLMDKRPLLAFQKAVQYCFQAWHAETAESNFRVEHLGAFVENIIDP